MISSDRFSVVSSQLILSAIQHGGTFLDIGCADGSRLESLMQTLRQRHISIQPYGIDHDPELIFQAIERLPGFWDQFFVGDYMQWDAPIQFDWVRTDISCIKPEKQKAFLLRLLTRVVKSRGGTLLICENAAMEKTGGLRLAERVRQLGFRPTVESEEMDLTHRGRMDLLKLSIPEEGISPIPAEWTHSLRHSVLRPHQSISEMSFAGDSSSRSLHLARFSKGSTVAIVSLIDEEAESTLRLRGMAVSGQLQGRGYGSELIQEAVSYAQLNNLKEIWCNARASALYFYKKHGFKTVGHEFQIEGIGPHYKMILKL